MPLSPRSWPRRLAGFLAEVFAAFSRNRGLLLAGGVAYNTLLSMVPLIAIALVGLSAFFPREQLLSTIRAELGLLVPGHVDAVVDTVTGLLDSRDVLSVVLVAVLLFLSSLAFRMVEDAFAVIFSVAEGSDTRPFWLRALVPYAFVLVLTIGLFALTAATSVLEALVVRATSILEIGMDAGSGAAWLLRASGLLGSGLLFSALYSVLPQRPIGAHRALSAGFGAALLWEPVRGVVVWYLGNVSLVGAVYGSLATVVIVLLTLEVAAVILLLGAQAVAVLEARADRRARGEMT
ncbi:MAG: YihY/virulence factor BrkB family protein [Planctomycetes bacterium]|nr:YihY/virulence factor BrkB family protein [Deltaproteobacteria bacterium]MCB9875972.1 YihY/virulence factor BrkB family protein [Planctomycetota bacterium]